MDNMKEVKKPTTNMYVIFLVSSQKTLFWLLI